LCCCRSSPSTRSRWGELHRRLGEDAADLRLLITTALDALIGWAALKRLKPKQD
jgi:hypothetical protein